MQHSFCSHLGSCWFVSYSSSTVAETIRVSRWSALAGDAWEDYRKPTFVVSSRRLLSVDCQELYPRNPFPFLDLPACCVAFTRVLLTCCMVHAAALSSFVYTKCPLRFSLGPTGFTCHPPPVPHVLVRFYLGNEFKS